MGLWDILTREIKLGSHQLSWNEPLLCRTRLRGDFIWRIVISLSSWLAASGIMLLIFSSNQNPPSRGVAVGLGAVFGLGPAVMMLLVVFLAHYIFLQIATRHFFSAKKTC